MWFFAIVYAVEGIGQAKSGILGQPLTYFLKQVQGWEPTHISASLAALDVPWIIKPLWGAISDFVPLLGYRRRSWLVVANIAGIGAFAWVATLTDSPLLIPALVVTAIAMAVSSTLCGALLVETGQRDGNTARLVNQQWLWFNVAQMLAMLVAGYLIEFLPPMGALRAAAGIAAVAPLAIIASIGLIHEPKAAIDLASLRLRLSALVTAVRTRNLWLIAGFLFLYYFSPGIGTPLYFEMTDRLQFSQGLIGTLSAVAAGGWILGGVLHRVWLRHLGPIALLRWSIAGGVLSTLAYLAMSEPIGAVAIWLLSGVTTMIATIATLSLAAEVCPKGAEGFAFAAMMSILNIASPLADVIGSALYEQVFDHTLAPLIVVSAATTGLMYLLIPLMVARGGDAA